MKNEWNSLGEERSENMRDGRAYLGRHVAYRNCKMAKVAGTEMRGWRARGPAGQAFPSLSNKEPLEDFKQIKRYVCNFFQWP